MDLVLRLKVTFKSWLDFVASPQVYRAHGSPAFSPRQLRIVQKIRDFGMAMTHVMHHQCLMIVLGKLVHHFLQLVSQFFTAVQPGFNARIIGLMPLQLHAAHFFVGVTLLCTAFAQFIISPALYNPAQPRLKTGA